ncbi:MAG: hypothetical protein ACOX6E_05850 [Syntrophomonadaceae bacterium]
MFVKHPITKILIVFFLPIIIFLSVIQEKSFSQPCAPTIKNEELYNNTTYNAMLNSFAILSSFLNDVNVQNGYLIPQNGQTREMSIQYLSKGFVIEMATAILDEYTWLIPDVGLAIKPCDGLPILNSDDLPYLTYTPVSETCIIFTRHFRSCFSPDDHYCYSIEMTLYENCWKISRLSLEKL